MMLKMPISFQRQHSIACVNTQIADIGGKMRSDESHLKAADKKSGDGQHDIATMGEGFLQRSAS